MNIVELKYTQRINLGNYEHAELTATAVIEEGESSFSCVQGLKIFVEAALKGELKDETEPSPKKEVEDIPEIKEEVKEEPKKKAKKKAVKKKAPAKKKKNVAYDRANDAHKDEFASVLSEVAPHWKDTIESKTKAKHLSLELVGEDMFSGEDGSVLESFKELVVEGMSEDL